MSDSNKMSLQIKKYFMIIFSFMIVGIGFAFTLKANVGVGAWDALSP